MCGECVWQARNAAFPGLLYVCSVHVWSESTRVSLVDSGADVAVSGASGGMQSINIKGP